MYAAVAAVYIHEFVLVLGVGAFADGGEMVEQALHVTGGLVDTNNSDQEVLYCEDYGGRC